eukprot:jgi/Picre1/27800/NNA_000764.t1
MRPISTLDWSNEASTVYLSVVSVVLIGISGLCAGLTLALLSLDFNDLEILKRIHGAEGKRLAESVQPLLKKPHLLLVTLLLVNSLCMEALPLCLDRLLDPVSAIVISVTVILLFGEIIPQAVCKKHGLKIAANLAWLVKLMIFLTYPLSYPISKVLDALLGVEKRALFRRKEIEALIDAHVSRQGSAEDHLGEQPYISRDEAQIVHGALQLYEKNISDSMTSIDRVFRLDWNDVYDEDLLLNINESGHSRIPIWFGGGMSTMAFCQRTLTAAERYFTDEKRIRDIEELSGLLRDMPIFLESSKKIDCINHMMNAMRHMALVMDTITENNTTVQTDDAPLLVHGKRRVIGILTLEDLLEDLLVHEIVDETDTFKTNKGEQPLQDRYKKWKMALIEKRRRG